MNDLFNEIIELSEAIEDYKICETCHKVHNDDEYCTFDTISFNLVEKTYDIPNDEKIDIPEDVLRTLIDMEEYLDSDTIFGYSMEYSVKNEYMDSAEYYYIRNTLKKVIELINERTEKSINEALLILTMEDVEVISYIPDNVYDFLIKSI